MCRILGRADQGGRGGEYDDAKKAAAHATPANPAQRSTQTLFDPLARYSDVRGDREVEGLG